MKIRTEKRCGCRGPDGKKLKECPALKRQGHGTWSYRVRVPDSLVPLVGKQYLRGSGFSSKADAESAGHEMLTQIKAGVRVTGPRMTVGEYLAGWLEGRKSVRPSTLRSYRGHVNNHLLPMLGSIPLNGLQPEHISRAYERTMRRSEGNRQPTGPATIARIHATLRAALNDAVKRRLLTFNPACAVELPRYSPPEVEPWDLAEIGAFLDEAAKDRLGPMYELIALYGLRRGEACGLTWSGLDNAELEVRQQITDTPGYVAVMPPKTRSGRRRVHLAPVTVGSLLAHRLRQDEEREAVGPAWDNGVLPDERGYPVRLEGLMFTRPDGRYLDPGYVSRHMQVIARRVGLCTTVARDVPAGERTVLVGRLYVAPEGRWPVFRDRHPTPVCEVEVFKCERRRGSGARLFLSSPLPVDLLAGDELGRGLLPRQRLHGLRHGSASIQIGAGVDLALVSKVLGHSSIAVTGDLYGHLLPSAGRRVAETISSMFQRAHHVPTTGREGPEEIL